MSGQSDFGMVGLGTMGRSLLLNIADHGFAVAGLDTDAVKAEALRTEGAKRGAQGFTDPKEFVGALRKPRAVMILVPAGAPVDSVIGSLGPLLEPGDLLIDGGNSFFKDTNRRGADLIARGIGFIGLGVSGGESGARHGPSMTGGGEVADYERVRGLLEAVAAKANGEPCVALLGPGSAGHYVKMVHNGIEYGIMQLISEVYDLMKRGLRMSNSEIGDVFGEWNTGDLESFLIEITADVLRYPDENGGSLVDAISDKAKQKGTGKWSSQDAMDLGIPIPTIDLAVNARELSALKDERVRASKALTGPEPGTPHSADVCDLAEGALILAILSTYSQGFSQLAAASDEYGYGLNLERVASVWRAGCIIRARSLESIRQAFATDPELPNLMLSPAVAGVFDRRQSQLRAVLREMIGRGLPAPALSASLAYLDGYRSATLPTNLIQAQRDLFGAHTYERIDKEGSFHTKWQSE
jgi:6-phosphogluconate dehydrogenase